MLRRVAVHHYHQLQFRSILDYTRYICGDYIVRSLWSAGIVAHSSTCCAAALKLVVARSTGDRC